MELFGNGNANFGKGKRTGKESFPKARKRNRKGTLSSSRSRKGKGTLSGNFWKVSTTDCDHLTFIGVVKSNKNIANRVEENRLKTFKGMLRLANMIAPNIITISIMKHMVCPNMLTAFLRLRLQ